MDLRVGVVERLHAHAAVEEFTERVVAAAVVVDKLWR
jgi:hypothetical protein